jgi:sugar/nucleoside kinase (ribokinase family)
LAQADAVVVSLEDLAGDEAQVESLATACRLLVTTEGALGARVYWNSDVRRFAAPAVDQIDPTGAGDIFAASFFIRLHQTRDPWEAARYANLLAASSVARQGIAGVPSSHEVQQAGMVWAR